jgi:hypothetical protein
MPKANYQSIYLGGTQCIGHCWAVAMQPIAAVHELHALNVDVSDARVRHDGFSPCWQALS